MQLERTLQHPISMRAAPSAYVALLSIPGAVLVLYVLVAGSESSFWIGVAALLSFVIATTAWLATFRLELTNRVLIYRRLFGGTTILPLSEIDRAELRIGVFSFRDVARGTIRLELYPHASRRRRPLIINLKVFRKAELEEVFDYLPIIEPY